MPSEAASLGTRVHEAIAAVIRGDEIGIDAEVQPYFEQWWSGWWARNQGQRWQTEVAFAIDLQADTARVLDVENRGYPERAHKYEVCGTADAVFVSGKRGHIVDWKTGHRHVSAQENAQLMTLALALALAFNLHTVDVSIVQFDGDSYDEQTVTLCEFDLGSWRYELIDLIDSIEGSEPKTGPHCRNNYCRAYGACPATSHALEIVAPQTTKFPLVLDAAKIQSPEHARELDKLCRYAGKKVQLLRSALVQYVDTVGPIPLDEGMVWRRSESTREEIDLTPPGAMAALQRALGEHAEVALEHYTSKAAIKRAARVRAEQTGESMAAIERDVMAGLRAADAVKTRQVVTHREARK
jgi:hypothetical protein